MRSLYYGLSTIASYTWTLTALLLTLLDIWQRSMASPRRELINQTRSKVQVSSLPDEKLIFSVWLKYFSSYDVTIFKLQVVLLLQR